MLLKLAWKNIWRNKLRSFVILTAIGLGLMVSIFAIAFMNGMIKQKVDDVINTEMTHLQVNRQSFIDDGSIESFFNAEDLEEQSRKIDGVVGVSPRLRLSVMMASPYKMGGVTLVGIDPEKEKTVSYLYENIPDSLGTYFECDLKNSVVVGRKLAEEYKIKLRSKIVLSFTDVHGEYVTGVFRVCGIFTTNNPQFESSEIFVKSSEIREFVAMNVGEVHELSIRLSDNSNKMLATVTPLVKKLLHGDEIIRSWKEISAMMAMYTDFMQFFLMIIVVIILFALGFGIVNVVLMSVVERRREFSMLMAIGMNKKRLMGLVVLESTILTIIGGFTGMIIGVVMVWISSQTGIDVSAKLGSYSSMGIATLVYPRITLMEIIPVSILIAMTGVLSAIYPAYKAIKVNPADGIK